MADRRDRRHAVGHGLRAVAATTTPTPRSPRHAVPRRSPVHHGRRRAADDSHAPILDVKALIVAEYYPRAGDPVRGVWAHRQALAARDAGCGRPGAGAAPADAVAVGAAPAWPARRVGRQPAHARLDGLRGRTTCAISPRRTKELLTWGSLGRAGAAPGHGTAAPGVPVRSGARALRRAGRRRGAPRGGCGADDRLGPRPRRTGRGTPGAGDRDDARGTHGSCSPTAPGPRGGAPSSGARDRASSTSVPTCRRRAAPAAWDRPR